MHLIKLYWIVEKFDIPHGMKNNLKSFPKKMGITRCWCKFFISLIKKSCFDLL